MSGDVAFRKFTAEEYYNGDQISASVWKEKYASLGEINPDDMHLRLARSLAWAESHYKVSEDEKSIFGKYKASTHLSKFGRKLPECLSIGDILQYLKRYKYIVPQGSIMSILGTGTIGSLSNCFVIPSPIDSYAGIFWTDQQIAQLEKRRGGVGTNLNTLRPSGMRVNNAAKSSTGAHSFMNRFSSTTREVAQNGRRGALMLLMSCLHPDIFEFVSKKRDRTQVTGANISVMLTDEFLKCVKEGKTFFSKFPIDAVGGDVKMTIPYSAKELYSQIIENAWENAEPGVAFIDRIVNYSPEGVYDQYKPVASNPCFHPDTLIETVNGRIKIKDLTEDMNVYSMDKNGKLCIRRASKSFISKKNAKTLKIKLRSGNEIQVTPEHKLFVHDKGWVEAKDLVLGDRIAHLCRSRRGSKYSGVYLTTDPLNKDGQVMEHRLVTGVNDLSINVHHKNRNTYDNKISNLEILRHSEHSRITALEDNSQQHQVKGKRGRFISTGKSPKTIIGLPNELKTGMNNQFSNAIILIEDGETTDVYDIQVSGTHCLIANNMVAHNCGEQWMNAYDACRLLALNFYNIVTNHFTKDAKIDYDKLYEIAYIQQRLADDIVDLEITQIDKIIAKIISDPEPEHVKMCELDLWKNIKDVASKSRRTGCGFTALADMLASLSLKYDSDEAISVIKEVMKTKLRAELDCTIDLAILRGSFDGWDRDKEFISTSKGLKGQNEFYQMMIDEFPEQAKRMYLHGRRNVSWSTVAPTGTVSLVSILETYSNTSAGIEPQFRPYFFRNVKINADDPSKRVDFTDQNGDKWMTYAVVMGGFKEYIKKHHKHADYINIENLPKDVIEELYKKSPYYNSCAEDISWEKRIEIQSIVQRYTTNAISSTINLPKNISKETISDIYSFAWEKGLKGVTVYRDGSRTGVLVKEKNEQKFEYHNAPKRPKDLKCDIFTITAKGKKWNVIVGIMDDKPYEVFAVDWFFTSKENMKLRKIGKGRYDLMEGDETYAEDISSEMKDEECALTRMISTSLRHGSSIDFIVEQLNKSHGTVVSFSKAISRVLAKYAKKSEKGQKCQNCGSENIKIQEGCSTCQECGSSKCG